MPQIKVMSKELVGLIAAGEVVERPASVIKELLENSIDAGASNITVEIKNGGISYIRITDDGCGIAPGDVHNAFVSHATSKLFSADGLSAINTLGFRGEALASVAAVAKVELLTREKSAEIGTRYVIEAGEEISLDDAGCPQGTTIVVRDLFYNTPARMKFLKKDVSEGNTCAGVVDRLALSHPDISFRFIRDGKQTLLTGGSGNCLDAAREIFGKAFASALIPAESTVDGVRVDGYITKPSESRPNRNMQFFFINGRLVRTGTGSAAISEAYRNSIMVGKFPGCILNIEVEPQSVDVNVHPAKIEVRFADEKKIFNAVYYACKGALGHDRSVKEIVKPLAPVKDYYKKSEPTAEQLVMTSQVTASVVSKAPAAYSTPPATKAVFASPAPASPAPADDLPDLLSGAAKQKTVTEPQLAVQAITRSADAVQAPKAEFDEESFHLVGEVFRTYIICEVQGKVLFIDKHAAHERIIYEQLKKNEHTSAQLLVSPVTVTLTKEEYSAVLDNLDLLANGGFAVEDFGSGTVIVRECPMELSPADIAEVICEIAGRFADRKQELMYDKLDWLYHSVACRSAIKAGDFTSRLEMERFAKQLLSMPEIRSCPHGRPVMVEMTQRELEKNFGRV